MGHVTGVKVRGSLVDRVQKTDLFFQPGVNVLVGPNGCGKTTVMNILSQRFKNEDSMVEVEGMFSTYSYDFEKDNPRMKGRLSEGVSAGFQLASHYQSHGEVVRSILKMMTRKDASGAVFFIDEPEMALDVYGLMEFRDILQNTEASQVILITHSPILMLAGFHVVEMVDGYVDVVRDEMKKLL